jgi:peptidoglycan/xylan/chitin deacetylase (PgdA/CDA1 family)
MAYWHVSKWMKRLYPDIVWNIQDSRKTLYLTFDDGPTPKITEKVLDILDSYQAKGTFFCLGRNVDRHPEIYKEIIRQGHMTGNHTYSHLKGWRTKNFQYLEDIELARKYIRSSLFRPPYGQIRRSQIRTLKPNYRIILWEVMSHDYEQRISKERSFKALLRYTKEGSILVFHDSVKAYNKLEYILPRILDYFSNKGFTFESIK